MKPNDAAIRKRTQIAKANRTMFIWIAVASALVGTAVVVSYFLIQNLTYNEKVLLKKTETDRVVTENNKAVPKLSDAIRVLDTSQALAITKANSTDQAIQVILDALPSDANSLALGSSLQNKLLVGIDGLTTLESLQVDPVQGVEATDASTSTIDASENAAAQSLGVSTITFQFTVKGSQAALQKVLENLQRSIRTINVTSVRIENEGSVNRMTVLGQAFYLPSTTLKLEQKAVPR